jgi:hypothetical protein
VVLVAIFFLVLIVLFFMDWGTPAPPDVLRTSLAAQSATVIGGRLVSRPPRTDATA